MQGIEPIFKTGNVRWYDKIQPNKTYVVGLDPSAGVGQDHAAIEVFSLPDMKQVAEWSHNRTSIPNQVKTMQGILKYIHDEMRSHKEQKTEPDIYFTLENNSWGEAAVLTIDEIGEERFAGNRRPPDRDRRPLQSRGRGMDTRGRGDRIQGPYQRQRRHRGL